MTVEEYQQIKANLIKTIEDFINDYTLIWMILGDIFTVSVVLIITGIIIYNFYYILTNTRIK